MRLSDTTIEIFYNHNRIASHRRLKGRTGQYSTITGHMPEDHQKYLEWNGRPIEAVWGFLDFRKCDFIAQEYSKGSK